MKSTKILFAVLLGVVLVAGGILAYYQVKVTEVEDGVGNVNVALGNANAVVANVNSAVVNTATNAVVGNMNAVGGNSNVANTNTSPWLSYDSPLAKISFEMPQGTTFSEEMYGSGSSSFPSILMTDGTLKVSMFKNPDGIGGYFYSDVVYTTSLKNGLVAIVSTKRSTTADLNEAVNINDTFGKTATIFARVQQGNDKFDFSLTDTSGKTSLSAAEQIMQHLLTSIVIK